MALTLAQLSTYPIKSCGSNAHHSRELDKFGLVGDRRWMVITPDGEFLTQRECPALALIQPSLEPHALLLDAPRMKQLRLSDHSQDKATTDVHIWRSHCHAVDAGDAAAAWLSDFLHLSVRLVQMGADFHRQVSPEYAPKPSQVSFADGYPLLIVSQASLDALNQRLAERGSEPVSMNRFRPNLVIEGAEPFAEDTWRTVQIGEVVLDVVKPCARCVMTTVDQATGTIPNAAEPLATLATFRRWQNGKVMFAQNAIHRAPGTLHVGAPVSILEYAKH